MITYKANNAVYLENKFIGEIRKVEGGYQYWPQGKKKYADPDDIFPTIAEVKNILEEE